MIGGLGGRRGEGLLSLARAGDQNVQLDQAVGQNLDVRGDFTSGGRQLFDGLEEARARLLVSDPLGIGHQEGDTLRVALESCVDLPSSIAGGSQFL